MGYSWRDGLRWLNPRRFVSADLRRCGVLTWPKMPFKGQIKGKGPKINDKITPGAGRHQPPIGTVEPPTRAPTRAPYLGHRNIQHTVRYTELSPTCFKNLWRD
jgi:hypothetical protein